MSRRRPLVLLVEDLEFNRDLLLQALGNTFDTEVVTGGHAAIETARNRLPDVILMDLSLPDLDAWEATRRLRAVPQLSQTIIIALTAHAMGGDRQRALEAGADDFLIKPVDGDLLTTRIREWLARRR